LAAAATAVGIILFGRFDLTEWRTVLTVVGAFLGGAAALAALELNAKRRVRLVAWIVLAGAPVALAVFVHGVWSFVGDGPSQERYVDQASTAVVWLLAALIVTTAALQLRNSALLWTFVIAVGVSAVAAATAGTVLIWAEGDEDVKGRVLAALTIVTVAAFFLGPLLERASVPARAGAAREDSAAPL
jgi:hypothetical protein